MLIKCYVGVWAEKLIKGISQESIMYIFNAISLLGGLALFLYGMRLMSSNLKEGSSGTLKVVMEKVTNNPLKAFILGILCNILVCMAVLISFSVKDTFSKVIVIFIPIFLFIALGLEHSVANMYYLTAGYLNNGIGLKAILNNLIPVTLGNIVGGMGFGTIYYLINRK